MTGFGQPVGGGYGAPPGYSGGYPGQPGGYGAPGMAPAGPAPGNQPNFVLWMVLAIVSAVVCQGWLTGIPAFILALLASQEWTQGQYESAQGKLKWSKIITIIGFCLMGLAIAAYVLVIALGVGMAAASAPGSY